MLNYAARNVVARGRLLYRGMKQQYKVAVKGVIGAVCAVLVMWGLNVIGIMEVNFIPWTVATFVTAVWAFAPRRVFIAAGLGALVQGLRDEDTTQGAVKGIITWYQVVLGVLLWVSLVSFILATIPFKQSPSSFFPLAGGAFLLTLTFASVSNKWVRAIIAVIGVGVMVFHIWALVPQEWKSWWPSGSSAGVSATTPTLPTIEPVKKTAFSLVSGESKVLPKDGRVCWIPNQRSKGRVEITDLGDSIKVAASETVEVVMWQHISLGLPCLVAFDQLEAAGKIK